MDVYYNFAELQDPFRGDCAHFHVVVQRSCGYILLAFVIDSVRNSTVLERKKALSSSLDHILNAERMLLMVYEAELNAEKMFLVLMEIKTLP